MVNGPGVTLFATTSATTNALVTVDDTAAFNAPITATATTVASAAANTALRGVAFAPTPAPAAPSISTQPQDSTVTTGSTATLTVTATGTGPLSYQWYTGTAGDTSNPITGAIGSSYTTPALTTTSTYWVRVSGPGGTIDSRTATIIVTAAPNTRPTINPTPVPDLALTLGDPDNPPDVRTVDVADAETPASGLTVTVASSNNAVATAGATGTGTTRTLTVNPVGVGRATLTVTVSDGELSASTSFPVAVSGLLPTGTHNHYGASDASTAIDLGAGAMVVGDDENNTLRVYDRAHSRYPAQSVDLRAAGLDLRDSDPTHEIDIEASARTGNTIYWLGSHGQHSSAKDLPLPLRKSTSVSVPVGAPPACTSDVVTIGSVEGATDTSPVAGQTVSVRGTVVGDYEGASPALRGFYLQDSGDDDPATSDGIFVFDNGANLVGNGDVVQVTGSVSEFQGQTQITPPSGGVETCGRQATVTPTDLTLPRTDPADLEPYEGMLVRFHQPLTVTESFQLGRFGQVVVSSGGKLRQPTSVNRATDTAAVQALQHANDLNRLIIDDDLNNQNPDPIIFGRGGQPLSASNTLRGGDTVTDPVGVLTYTWAGNAASGNAYRLRPVNALGGAARFDAVNERPAAPPATGAGGVHVASANLLNFFNTFTGCTGGVSGAPLNCRGAENDTEYQRQLAKEVASLRFLNADVVGVMETENNGYGPSSAIQALVDALNAQDGAGAWAFVNPDAATGVTDVAGSDAIKAGLLYRTAAVTSVAGDTFVDQNNLFERRPVAQTFQTPAGSRFTVVANHFKSKDPAQPLAPIPTRVMARAAGMPTALTKPTSWPAGYATP